METQTRVLLLEAPRDFSQSQQVQVSGVAPKLRSFHNNNNNNNNNNKNSADDETLKKPISFV
jgi:hypothetical protein